MQNVNNERAEMLWQQFSETKVQAHAEFPGRLVQHKYSYGEFCTTTVTIRNTSKVYNTSYREVAPTMYNSVNGCNYRCSLCLSFCSRMRLNLPGMVLYYQQKEFALLGTQKSTRGRRMSFSTPIFSCRIV
jgi:hypothetical protein